VNKLKFIIVVFMFIIMFCIIGSFFIQADTEIIQEEDIIVFQNKITNDIKIYGYTLDNPNIIIDPYNENYNSALIVFETDDYVSINVNVNNIYTYDSKVTNKHYIGVYNLTLGKNIIILSIKNYQRKIEINISPDDKTIDFSKSIALSNGHLLSSTDKRIDDDVYTGIREIDALGKIYYEYLLEGGYRGIAHEIDEEHLAVLSDELIILDRQNGNVIDSFDISDYKTKWLAMGYTDNKINLFGENIAISIDMKGNISEIESIYEKEYFSGDINYNNREGIRFHKELKTKLSNNNIWLLNYKKELKEEIEIKKEFNRIIVSTNDNSCDNYLILDKLLDKRVYQLCEKINYIYTYDMEGKYSVYFKIKDKIYKTNKYLEF